jgi:hypothetical protein
MFFVNSVSDWKRLGIVQDIRTEPLRKCLVLAMRCSSTNPEKMEKMESDGVMGGKKPGRKGLG